MSEFKVGDRVTLNNGTDSKCGKPARITGYSGGFYEIVFDDGGDCDGGWWASSLKLIELKQYTLLKPVSIKSLEEAGGSCAEFRRGLADAVLITLNDLGRNGMALLRTTNLSLHRVEKIASQIPKATQFLIDKGFIEEKVERPDLEVDDRVFVRNDGSKMWFRRHFKCWVDDSLSLPVSMKTFQEGRTSWSDDGNEPLWNHWKLPEEK